MNYHLLSCCCRLQHKLLVRQVIPHVIFTSDVGNGIGTQMPTGTGKTITLLSLITSYLLAHPEVG